jgi:hypothetical protein
MEIQPNSIDLHNYLINSITFGLILQCGFFGNINIIIERKMLTSASETLVNDTSNSKITLKVYSQCLKDNKSVVFNVKITFFISLTSTPGH